MLDEVSRYCLSSIYSLLHGNSTLSDPMFKAVQRYIERTKRFGTSY